MHYAPTGIYNYETWSSVYIIVYNIYIYISLHTHSLHLSAGFALILNHAAQHHGHNYSMIAAVTCFCEIKVWQPTAVAVWAWFVAKRCTHLPLGNVKNPRDGVEKHSASRWQDSANTIHLGRAWGWVDAFCVLIHVLWQIQPCSAIKTYETVRVSWIYIASLYLVVVPLKCRLRLLFWVVHWVTEWCPIWIKTPPTKLLKMNIATLKLTQ